jgi:hypothetical protein
MSIASRFTNSWRLFKRSLSVMAAHPKLLFFPVVMSLCTFAILLFFLAPVALQPTGHKYTESAHWEAVANSVFTKESMDRAAATSSNEQTRESLRLTPRGMVYVAVLYFVAMFLGTFFSTAFYHEILSALQGGNVSVSSGLRFAASKLPTILMWSLFAGAVGYLIKLLEERVGLIGKWVLRLIGISWSLAAVFAIPIIVAEDEKNPVAILKRSAATLKKTWGESLAGFVGIQFGGMLVILSTVILFVVGAIVSAYYQAPWLILGLSVLWIVCLFAFFYTLSVASNIYRCALYLFAAQGRIPGYFDRESMDLAWKMKKR